MKIDSWSARLKNGWISRHPRTMIALSLLAFLVPFINKPIQTDDFLFVQAAKWIQTHPFDFFGTEVSWWYSTMPMWAANCNPPLVSYYFAAFGALFGWHEIILHLVVIPVALAAALGIYALAARWCQRPLLATIVAVTTPAFMVSSSTLMCDVPMLALWIWAFVFWERALDNSQSRWRFISVGALLGLAIWTKYSAITILPLLFILSILRKHRPGWWLAGLAVPVIMLMAYELLTARMYGHGLFSAAAHYARLHPTEFPGGWSAKTIIGLAFCGGSLLPLILFAPALWRPSLLVAGGTGILGLSLGLFWYWNNFGLVANTDPEMLKSWPFALQIAFWSVAGLHLLLLASLEAWKARSIVSFVLVLWILEGLLFAIVLNWTINARSILPIVPPAAILLARRLEATPQRPLGNSWLIMPLLLAAATTWYLELADYQMARQLKTAALELAKKYQSPSQKVWFESHGTFQYYMEQSGGLPIDFGRSLLQCGDVVIMPWAADPYVPFPAGSVELVDSLRYPSHTWVTLSGGTRKGVGGFYSALSGPVPFAFGDSPSPGFSIVRMASEVQCHSTPANSGKIENDDVPDFHGVAFSEKDESNLQARIAAEAEQCKAAEELGMDGNAEASIACYRQVLSTNSNNTVALNNLAWLLTTAGDPRWRNGPEAVRLASRAVELTDHRLPQFIGTLAAAEAEVGDFTNAVQTADLARVLALVTGQREIAKNNAGLMKLYAEGKTVGSLASQ